MVGGAFLMTGSLGVFAVGFGIYPLLLLAVVLVGAGLGIGALNVHLTSATIAVAAPGEEGVTASAMPAIRSLGVAFGAAGAGLLANAGGMARDVSPERVDAALTLVYSAFLLAPIAMIFFVFQFLRLQRRDGSVPVAGS
jgi:hypothetical protein